MCTSVLNAPYCDTLCFPARGDLISHATPLFVKTICMCRFDYYAIGGSPYRLPDNAEIGYSYIMFVVTLIFVFVSQLMTMKVLFEDFLP